MHRRIDKLDVSEMGLPLPKITLSGQEIAFGMTQNLFRRIYHGLRNEPMEIQCDLLSKIKAAAVELMVCGDRFQSTADTSYPSIKATMDVLYRYAQHRGLWDDTMVERAMRKDSRPNFLDLRRKRLEAHITGDELLDLWNDLERQDESAKQDYRQRLDPLLETNPVKDPLVVGVMTYGLYFAAMFYRAARQAGQQPELAVVKKSRQDREIHVFPAEEGMIQKAISSGRDIVVVDDIIHDFKGFFAIYDYFGKPRGIRFSAGSYTSPLPKELDIMERQLFEYFFRNRDMIQFADYLTQHSLSNILQYDMGIDREKREINILPPIVGDIF